MVPVIFYDFSIMFYDFLCIFFALSPNEIIRAWVSSVFFAILLTRHVVFSKFPIRYLSVYHLQLSLLILVQFFLHASGADVGSLL